MAPTRVQVEPPLLAWARRRAGIDRDELIRRFPKLEEWEEANARPTLKQLERFAQATNVSFGTLFLDSPPEEPLPIPDFRTIGDRSVGPPSGDLLDTLAICEQGQDWYRDHVQKDHGDPLPFVGSVTTNENPVEVARLIGSELDLREQMAADYKT
jgi:transcriptional regulator with XRE-family HTH domain